MSEAAPRLPRDEPVREAVRTVLDETLFVEAGAGTGKTTVLVERVCSLVESGVDIRHIAAITFTEKAAAELRFRVRRALSEHPSSPRIDAALEYLGEAPMSTLHAFARRILAEHGLAVALPPRFEVLDEVGEAILLEARWHDLAGRLFDTSDPLAPAVARAVELGLSPRNLREIAVALHDSYHRLRDSPTLWRWPTSRVDLEPVDLSELTEAIRHHLPNRKPRLDEYLRRAEDAVSDGDRLDVLRTEGVLPNRQSNAGKAVNAIRDELLVKLRREALDHIVGALAAAVLDWAEDRTHDGVLVFHDLLVLARDALRDPYVRSACRDRYERVLIDEFQDTDPLQIEIAVLLASSRPDIATREWHDEPLAPDDAGRLFFVGDPKQSIYRFRRADIELYERAQRVFAHPPLHLTENFRTVASIVDFVNDLFCGWMPDTGADGAQPEYVPLAPYREDHDDGPSFMSVGGECPGIAAADLRAIEADEVVRVVRQAKRDEWLIRDGEELRPAQYRDIAVLMPTRASLSALDQGLDAAQIPARVESRTLIWNTAEVRDLLAVLSAISDSNDQIAIVAALRSPGLACSDIDLATWRRAGGRWSFFAPTPPSLPSDHPVAGALGVLRSLHDERWKQTIGEIALTVIDVCRARELALAHARPRDRWRRIDFLLAEARAFEEAGGASIEEFVAWAREQAERDVWVNDAVAPDPDDDAVRILTVHAAKGLEFPIVVLMGLNVQYRSVGPPVLWGPDRPEVMQGRQDGDRFETAGYAELWTREKSLLEAERVRLAYVGMTRARDHLIVSLFRPEKETLAQAIARYDTHIQTLVPSELDRRAPQGGEAPAFDLEERKAWVEARAAALERLGRSPAIAATSLQHLAAGLIADDTADVAESPDERHDEADDSGEDDHPWRRGRAGTAIGRAVHAVLQTVDLATGAGVDDLAAAQAAAEGVPGLARDIARRVRGVLESASVRAAVASDRYWREIFVAVPIGDRVLEGFIDLLYETPSGDLVVVDYKTDGVRSEHDADEAVGRYRLQAAAYAVAVQRSLHRPVARCAFLFAGPGRCIERDLADVSTACAEVEALVSA